MIDISFLQQISHKQHWSIFRRLELSLLYLSVCFKAFQFSSITNELNGLLSNVCFFDIMHKAFIYRNLVFILIKWIMSGVFNACYWFFSKIIEIVLRFNLTAVFNVTMRENFLSRNQRNFNSTNYKGETSNVYVCDKDYNML